ncbi:MAG: hypothetical protein KC418_04345 [Anaerolineales bacterium]|nr:hypothetical protein [Anaerolineales bacterium]MCB8952746.1 hypothetical protein [Ardenticatenales bacterium]
MPYTKKQQPYNYYLPVLICSLLFLNACSARLVENLTGTVVSIPDVVVHGELSDMSRLAPEWSPTRGQAIGYVWPEERHLPPDERSQTSEINLSVGEAFDPYLILKSEKEETFLITMLVDFEQVAFELDGQKGLLHEVVVPPGSDLEIPIELDIPQPGIHEVIVFAFVDPYNGTLDHQYRMSTANKGVGRRAIVLVGDSNELGRQLPAPLHGELVPDGIDLGLNAAFATYTTREDVHPSKRQLYVTEAKPGETFNYHLWVSNLQGEMGADYALMMFYNFHQVPIQNQDVTVVRLEPGEEIVIPTSQQLVSEPGVNQLQVVYIFDPYRSILNKEVRAAFVLSDFRIAVDTSGLLP